MFNMSGLLPPFKCPPDNISVPSTISFAVKLQKRKEHICFRAQCMLSTALRPTSSATTTVLDVDNLMFPSLEDHLNSVSTHKPWTFIGETGPPNEKNFEARFATDKLLTNEDATIVAASDEAVALAKAAVKVAKDAAFIINNRKTATSTSKIGLVSDSIETEIGNSPLNITKDYEDLEPTLEELEQLQVQLSESIAVRSERQTERKARRSRAAEKSATNFNSIKSDLLGQKIRVSVQEVDYSDPLRYLRSTTNSSRLLTTKEELELSKGIQVFLKLEKLHEELKERCGGGDPTFAQWAAVAGLDQKTLRMRLNYGVFCKDKMIKSNIRLVISIAKNYQRAGMNLQDLVQEGCRGLIKAAEKFDASKGFKFSTYGHWWIKQSVRKALSDQSRLIRLPFHMVETAYRVKETRKQLYSENGKQPNDEEVAEATGISMKRLTTVLQTPKSTRSLDQKIGFDLNLKPSEVIADPDAESAEDLLLKQYMKQDLEKVLDTLNPREKNVIRWRFGLDDGRRKTLQEIGDLMGVSRERIRQIENCAFRKLKNKGKTKHLQQYLVSS